jgi:hypothetical protein
MTLAQMLHLLSVIEFILAKMLDLLQVVQRVLLIQKEQQQLGREHLLQQKMQRAESHHLVLKLLVLDCLQLHIADIQERRELE